jgi:hypothetical protein
MKIAAFWDIASCSLVEVDRSFRGAYCLHHQGNDDCFILFTALTMESVRTS